MLTLLRYRTLYGWATGSYFPLFAIYLFGELTSIVYVSVYFRWTQARSYAVKTIVTNIVILVLLTAYAVLGMTGVTGQTADQVGDTVGYMMTVGCLLPYVAPLETIKTVVKTRSGASIPLGMCLAGAVSNALWVLEGYLDDDFFMLILSAACSFMGFVQVTLYLIYRPGRYPAPLDTPNVICVLPATANLTVKSDTTVASLPSPNFISICSP
jgi:solute carrier family 50 protein (sugar transporter)